MESFFKDHFSKAFADGFPRVFPDFFRFVRVPVVVIVAVALVAVVVVVVVAVEVVVYISLCSEVVVVVSVVKVVVSGGLPPGLTSPFSKGAKRMSRNVGLPILCIEKFEERGGGKITTGRTGSVPAERS